jgi:RNA polymerase sigma factor (TIGR02999 family)
MLDRMSDVTRILSAIGQGDPNAAGELLPVVYDELRLLAAQRLAHETPGQTLQPTALVHEAYLRLLGGEEEPHWDSRGHFFAAAAEAMRRILTLLGRCDRWHVGWSLKKAQIIPWILAASGSLVFRAGWPAAA